MPFSWHESATCALRRRSNGATRGVNRERPDFRFPTRRAEFDRDFERVEARSRTPFNRTANARSVLARNFSVHRRPRSRCPPWWTKRGGDRMGGDAHAGRSGGRRLRPPGSDAARRSVVLDSEAAEPARGAGVSGIVSGALATGGADRAWRIAFLVGLPLAWLVTRATGDAHGFAITGEPPLLVAGGFLVGFGTRLGAAAPAGTESAASRAARGARSRLRRSSSRPRPPPCSSCATCSGAYDVPAGRARAPRAGRGPPRHALRGRPRGRGDDEPAPSSTSRVTGTRRSRS
jgi:hypothetical protein